MMSSQIERRHRFAVYMPDGGGAGSGLLRSVQQADTEFTGGGRAFIGSFLAVECEGVTGALGLCIGSTASPYFTWSVTLFSNAGRRRREAVYDSRRSPGTGRKSEVYLAFISYSRLFFHSGLDQTPYSDAASELFHSIHSTLFSKENMDSLH